MELALADRLQFAFTIMFHYLFPIGTMGIAPFIAWFAFRAVRYGDEEARQAARFWTKIFAVNFAAGVVTGIPMEFQFGTNWAAFSERAGSVIGQPLAMEGLYAFFLESVFLGILLYGEARVRPALYLTSAICVWLGSWLSGYFVIVVDAWMQHPVGYAIAGNRIELVNLPAVLFSKFALWQTAHAITAAFLAGSFIVAGVGAFYLLARRDESFGRRFLRIGVIAGAIASLVVIFPTGDQNAADVTDYQPIKLAAMEGLFESTHGAPMAIIGMPSVETRTLIDPVFVPSLLSYLAYGNFNSTVKGLTAYADELWPPVELTYYAYHIMVGLGTIFSCLTLIALLLLWRRRLYGARPLLWAIMLATPFPYIANEAGWTVTEVGRQPWIVYGLMRTDHGISPTVATGETVFTLIGFVGMYLLLGLLYLYFTLHEIGLGPARDEHPAATGAP